MLNGWEVNKFEEVGLAAVAIARTSPDTRHLGFLLRNDNNQLKLMHYAFHKQLIVEDPEVAYGWVNFDFMDPINMGLFVDYCFLISENNHGSIPYSILYDGGDYFDLHGEYLTGQPGHGLTCATFILSLFAMRGYGVVDAETWGNRPGDFEWYMHWIRPALRNPHRGVSVEHVAEQDAKAMSFSRYRPEEVACAIGKYSGQPMAMAVAEDLGKRLVAQMDEIRLPLLHS